MELTWGAARRFRLTIEAAGPDVAGAFDTLLTQWRDHLHGLPEAAADDTAAEVDWPSRDVAGAAPLLRHGFVPAAVVAARLTPGTVAEAGAPQPAPEAGAPAPVAPVPAAPPGLGIRRAGPGDLDAVVDLGMEVIRYDANFGGVTERPWTRSALTQDAARLLADAQPWVWLAERDGQPVGLVAAHAPEHAAWIAPMAGPSPVAYLYLGGVRAAHRAAGVGAALAARLAAETERHSVPVTLLHYAPVNPLSVPFWSQQGYRPLWTAWEARPATAVR